MHSTDGIFIVDKTAPSAYLPKKEIKKGEIGNESRYTFDDPVYLPWDKDLLTKTPKDGKIPVSYFAQVLKAFLEGTLPDLLPENYYDTMTIDRDNLDSILINPKHSHNICQSSFHLDFSKIASPDLPNLPRKYEEMTIRTRVYISSLILFNNEQNDSIKNGFFPKFIDKKLQPVHGVGIRPIHTFLELPKIIFDENDCYSPAISAPILQALLTEAPIFLPNYSQSAYAPSHEKVISDRDLTIRLKDSEMETIKNAIKFRDQLAKVMITHKSALQDLAEKFAATKNKRLLACNASLEDFNTELLYTYFHKINDEIKGFKKNISSRLKFNKGF